MANPGVRIAVIAPTYEAARDVCIEGESGLLYCLPPEVVGNGWNRSLGELTLVNGTIYKIYTSEKPDRLRGPQFHRGWCDELPSFKYAQETWDMYQMGLRLGRNPQTVITTTPRPIKLIKDLIAAKDTFLVTGSTFENQDNLPTSFISILKAKYEGTRLGQQELYARVLEDTPGALWNSTQLEATRIINQDPYEVAKRCLRVVVAIDPAVTSGEDADETGIICAGIDKDGVGYVLEDRSMRDTPKAWAAEAIDLLRKFRGDRIVAETNNGGDMVEDTIRSIDDTVPFKKVVASRGKYVRAEPISALYEQGRVHHIGRFDIMEDQMCSFTVDNIAQNSPDRVDALVWALSDLFSGAMTFGALTYMKNTQAQAEAQVEKVATAQAVKIAVSAKSVLCPQCESPSVIILLGDYRCNSCGNVWGGSDRFVQPPQRREEFLKLVM